MLITQARQPCGVGHCGLHYPGDTDMVHLQTTTLTRTCTAVQHRNGEHLIRASAPEMLGRLSEVLTS